MKLMYNLPNGNIFLRLVMVVIRLYIIQTHCSNKSINMHFILSADLSGYRIWILGNSHMDQSQLAVRHGNR